MFNRTCQTIRGSLYGTIGTSDTAEAGTICSTGTAFMVSPGILVTAAHTTQYESGMSLQYHKKLEVIRAPEIGRPMESARIAVIDPERDIALLRINHPRSTACVSLEPGPVTPGVSCGSLGFPLSTVDFLQQGRKLNLIERFQGAFISSSYTRVTPSGTPLPCYETDALMYGGSSGCPVFLQDGGIIGMVVASQIATDESLATADNENPLTRLAISILVPSYEILAFARANGVPL